MGVGAVPYDAARFVLVETEINKRANEVARLRTAARECPPDVIRHRVVGAFVIAQEGIQVARGGEADAQDQRILRGEHQLILECRIEAAFHANFRRVRFAREWRPGAIGECPGVARNRDRQCVRGRPLTERRLCGIERERPLVGER